jgi:hypothetical protein
MDAKTQQQYAETFHGLHRKWDPLVLTLLVEIEGVAHLYARRSAAMKIEA